MNILNRKITFRLYPNATQSAALDETLALHCRTYNALLEEHARRYEAEEGSYTFTRMCADLTQWRASVDALKSLNAQSLQVTAKRVALAFNAFFRRTAEGNTPGYPRFKSLNRFSGWGYKTYGDGWKLRTQLSSTEFGYDRISLTGIGDLKIRGKGRFVGSPKTCEIQHKHGKWYASVTFEVAEYRVARPTGNESAAFDWGINTLLTIAKGDGTLTEVDNPRWLKTKLNSIKTLQRVISAEEAKLRLCLGKAVDVKISHQEESSKLKRLYRELRNIHSKLARQRKDFYHKLTTMLVERFAFLGTEELAVRNMTKAPKAKENPDKPGDFLPNGAAAKAGLNRSILDAAPSMLINMLKTKAEEAGSVFALANTRVLKPTQRCSQCGTLVPKVLSERVHRCTCGCNIGRDENAAKTILRWMFEGDFWKAGNQPGSASYLETPSIAAYAA